jgi:hypothetical protein
VTTPGGACSGKAMGGSDTADSLATARSVRYLRTWVTDEYEHDGLRVSGGRVLDRLIRLVRGEL